ncbi:phosphoserine phosphatase SerB [Alteromonas aestuariivivens]|uniref:Phosphoserine phosphatase n=2 Tax=Alteromonas aestuariivivens TaxID=1938339 RepID=A0A3D8MF37_9ALTE|nr:phosphoserine phosphatase SerB [Alteromonas aestuariivivens]
MVQPRVEEKGSMPRIVVAAQALTLHQLEGIFTALQSWCVAGPLVKHPFSERFGDTVVSAPVRQTRKGGLQQALGSVAETYHADIAVVNDSPLLTEPGLLVMDMDSTVIQIECIDEIAKLAGLGEQVAAVTAQAMRGELAFSESLISRVACLKGVPVAQLEQIRNQIPLMPGVATLIAVLKQHNWRVAIASGGFTYFADYLCLRLGLDEARSNTLEVQDGNLTGRVLGNIVDAKVKALTVQELQQKWQIADSQTIAMGDGANDLLMMETARLGVACHAKPIVNEKADVAIRYTGLQGLLYYLNC